MIGVTILVIQIVVAIHSILQSRASSFIWKEAVNFISGSQFLCPTCPDGKCLKKFSDSTCKYSISSQKIAGHHKTLQKMVTGANFTHLTKKMLHNFRGMHPFSTRACQKRRKSTKIWYKVTDFSFSEGGVCLTILTWRHDFSRLLLDTWCKLTNFFQVGSYEHTRCEIDHILFTATIWHF